MVSFVVFWIFLLKDGTTLLLLFDSDDDDAVKVDDDDFAFFFFFLKLGTIFFCDTALEMNDSLDT